MRNDNIHTQFLEAVQLEESLEADWCRLLKIRYGWGTPVWYNLGTYTWSGGWFGVIRPDGTYAAFLDAETLPGWMVTQEQWKRACILCGRYTQPFVDPSYT